MIYNSWCFLDFKNTITKGFQKEYFCRCSVVEQLLWNISQNLKKTLKIGSFPSRISLVNVKKTPENFEFVHIY